MLTVRNATEMENSTSRRNDPPECRKGDVRVPTTKFARGLTVGSQDLRQAGCDAGVGLRAPAPRNTRRSGNGIRPTRSDQQYSRIAGRCAGLINLRPESASSASISLGNKTTNAGGTFSADAPPGARLSRNCPSGLWRHPGRSGTLAKFSTVRIHRLSCRHDGRARCFGRHRNNH
jgi:hypothetical protein